MISGDELHREILWLRGQFSPSPLPTLCCPMLFTQQPTPNSNLIFMLINNLILYLLSIHLFYKYALNTNYVQNTALSPVIDESSFSGLFPLIASPKFISPSQDPDLVISQPFLTSILVENKRHLQAASRDIRAPTSLPSRRLQFPKLISCNSKYSRIRTGTVCIPTVNCQKKLLTGIGG